MNLKSFAVIGRVCPVIALILTTTLLISDRNTVNAQFSKWNYGKPVPNTIGLPQNRNIYLLTSDNTIYQFNPDTRSVGKFSKVKGLGNGILIGIDFRPSDGKLYGLTDTGSIYTIDTSGKNSSQATPVSTLTQRFAAGFQSLFDFNPVVDAVRMIGTDDTNYAAVNSNGGSLNLTAAQASLAYAVGDINAAANPNIAAGSYTNNVKSAASTLFYGLDYDLDTVVTIADKNAGGSSNTGGGKLQTIGSLIDKNGQKINISPTADLDVYTDANGTNFLVGVSGSIVFTIDLNQINASLPLGTAQDITARGIVIPILRFNFPISSSFIDIAVPTN